jgi:UDP-N-acetylglucosamine--N-acetylmuramyl-(pentapeptide) pyrophosphoryl-undecaprenol N-acetylglucosamine transferase
MRSTESCEGLGYNSLVKTLFVASGGGHLEELWHLQPRLSNVASSRAWVTFDTPQSRSLLAGEECLYVHPSVPRDVRAMLHNLPQARKILGTGEWSGVVSTGSLVAVPFLSLARAHGIPCYFIESAARTDGPSLSGRLLEWVPGVHRYCQYEGWSRRVSWEYGGSVFDGFGAGEVENSRNVPEIRRVVVTLGANRYDFGRLIEGVQRILPVDAEVLWQTGHTDITRFGIEAAKFLPSAELAYAMRAADLVIAHAGVGSALAALKAGRVPLLVPRRKQFGEHVDDHQVQIARHLAHRGIAMQCDASELTAEIAVAAAARCIQPVKPPAFILRKP